MPRVFVPRFRREAPHVVAFPRNLRSNVTCSSRLLELAAFVKRCKGFVCSLFFGSLRDVIVFVVSFILRVISFCCLCLPDCCRTTVFTVMRCARRLLVSNLICRAAGLVLLFLALS